MASTANNQKRRTSRTTAGKGTGSRGGSRKRSSAGSSRAGSRGRTAAKRVSSANKTSAASRQSRRQPVREEHYAQPIADEIRLVIILAAAAFLLLSIFGMGGPAGSHIASFLYGMLGRLAVVLPFAIFIGSAFIMSNRHSRLARIKLAAAACFLFFLMTLLAIVHLAADPIANIIDAYQVSSATKAGGGLIGNLLGMPLLRYCGRVGGTLIAVCGLVISGIFVTGKRMFISLFRNLRLGLLRLRARAEQRSEERALARQKAQEEAERDRMLAEAERARQEEAVRRQEAALAKKEQARKARSERQPASAQIDTLLADEEDKEGAASGLSADKAFGQFEEDLPHPAFTITVDGESSAADSLPDKAAADAAAEEHEKKKSPQTGDKTGEERKTELGSIQIPDFLRGGKSSPARTSRMKRAGDFTFTSVPEKKEAAAEGKIVPPPFMRMNHIEEEIQKPEKPAVEEEEIPLQQPAGPEDLPEEMPSEESTAEPAQEEDLEAEIPAFRPASSPAQEEAVPAPGAPAAGEEVQTAPVSYEFPPLSLLEPGRSGAGADKSDLKKTAAKLQETFDSFGVGVTVTNVSCGPTVTRYEVQPDTGVKVSRIVSLSDDIQMNLAASEIRIEAPIPGKAAVGIEVPNASPQMVHLRELLDSDSARKAGSKIAFALGKDIGGTAIFANIEKMPHLLIAGTTGSGKSVCINTMIMSILYRADPTDVRMLMIDPKVVELTGYNGIPHLITPVVTDPKKAAGALQWAVNEMMRRYNEFSEAGVKDIGHYNSSLDRLNAGSRDGRVYRKLPQIVIIIDELADLMMVAPADVEGSINRLAQLARAAGMHLVIATQRPSVNVITGLIKANVPARIAFKVSSGVDSRTILDRVGAEKLIGNGDMLFFQQGFSKPKRVQGAFVSEEEIARVVDFIKDQYQGSVQYSREVTDSIETSSKTVGEKVSIGSAASTANEKDLYLEEAGILVIEKDKASIGMLQRAFKIGFNRAARIMDQLAGAGVVGPEIGTKPRKIWLIFGTF